MPFPGIEAGKNNQFRMNQIALMALTIGKLNKTLV